MSINIPVEFTGDTSDVVDSLDDVARAGDKVANSVGTALADDLDRSADSAKRFRVSAEGAATGADGLASGSSQAAGGLGDLGGALSLIPGPLGGIGAGMELAAPAIMGVTGAADLVNLAFEKMKIATIASKIATAAQTAVQTVATVATNVLAVATRALGVAIRFATGPIGIAIAVIALLVGGIILAYNKSETFRNIVNGLGEIIANVVVGAFNLLKDAIGFVVGVITGAFEFLLRFKQLFLLLLGPIGAVILIFKNWGKITEIVSSVFNAVKGVISGVFGSIKDLVVNGVQKVVDLFLGIPGALAGLSGKMLQAGKDLIGSLFEGIKNAAGAAGGFVADIAGKLKDAIVDILQLPLTVGPLSVLGKQVLPKITLIPAFAGGTDFAPGGVSLVGEQGPELVNLPRGSRVKTASQTREALGGNSTVEVNQNFFGPTTGSERLREIEWTLRYATRPTLGSV